MKKLVAFFILIGLSLTVQAQQYVSDEILQDYTSMDGVMSFSFKKDLTDILDEQMDFEEDELQISGDINMGRLTIFPEDRNAKDWAKDIAKRFSKEGLELLLTEKEDDSEVRIYGLQKGKHFTEIQIIAYDYEESSFVIISVYGKIKVEKKK